VTAGEAENAAAEDAAAPDAAAENAAAADGTGAGPGRIARLRAAALRRAAALSTGARRAVLAGLAIALLMGVVATALLGVSVHNDTVARDTAETALAAARADTDQVVVLVFLDQATTSKALTAPRLDNVGVRVTATDVDGKWLISQLDRL
jgi:hypothetical protein